MLGDKQNITLLVPSSHARADTVQMFTKKKLIKTKYFLFWKKADILDKYIY